MGKKIIFICSLVFFAFAVKAQVVDLTPVHGTCGSNDCGITAVGSGGTGTGYTYSLDDIDYSNTTGVFIDLAPGDYTVWVQDDGLNKGSNLVTVYEQLEASAVKTDITCNGLSNGEIVITADCGVGGYSYDWSASTFDPGDIASASNLPVGTYTIVVTSGTETVSLGPYDVIEPADFPSFVTSGNHFECAGGGDGEIIVTPSNGTADYDINLFDGTMAEIDAGVGLTPGPQTFSGLSEDAYTIRVFDANGCAATNNDEVVNVQNDAAAPTFTAPENKFYTPLEFNGSHNDNDPIVSGLAIGTYAGGPINGSFDSDVLDLQNYGNVRLSISVAQTATASWGNSDSISVHISTNGGTDFSPVWVDKCVFNGMSDAVGEDADGLIDEVGNVGPTPVTVVLSDADFTANVVVRVYYSVNTPGVSYDITSINVVADERYHTIPVTTSWDVIDEDDGANGSGSKEATFIDDVTWVCYDVGEEEIYIQRKWTAEDNCGNLSPEQIQIIRVGTPPYFQDGTFPASTKYNFCDLSPTISAPTGVDDCSGGAVIWEVLEIVGATGSGDLSGVLFEAGNTYTVAWTVTDDIGLSYTQDQTIEFNSPITATLVPTGGIYDYCVNGSVELVVTPSGGTGVFDATSFSDGTGNWSDPSYTVSTSWATDGNVNYSIDITDLAVDDQIACPLNFSSEEIRIHQNISTGSVTRE